MSGLHVDDASPHRNGELALFPKKKVLTVEILDDDDETDSEDLEMHHMSPPGSQVPDWDNVWGECLVIEEPSVEEVTGQTNEEAEGSSKDHTRPAVQAPLETPKSNRENRDDICADLDECDEAWWEKANVWANDVESSIKKPKRLPSQQPDTASAADSSSTEEKNVENLAISSKKRKQVSQDSESTDEQSSSPKKQEPKVSNEQYSGNKWNQQKLRFHAPDDHAGQEFEDKDGKWYLPVGRTLRVFKRGETFESDSAQESLKGYLFTLTDCAFKSTRKYAVCEQGACMYLKETFIGEAHSQRLCRNSLWRQRFQGDDFNMVRCFGRHMLEERKLIPLHVLGKLVKSSKRAPDPFLVYDSPPTDAKMSQNYRFAYMSHEMLDRNKWTDRKGPSPKLRVLDLFAGCGGMHLGFKQAGFHPKACLVENDTFAEATLRANFHEAEVFCDDVCFFLECCIERRPGYPNLNDFDHVHASSPCQGFSRKNRNYNGGSVPSDKDTVSNKPSEKDLANNRLAHVFVDVLRHFKLKTASFENVTGMLWDKNEGLKHARKIIADLLEIGYQCRLFTVNASEHGDPQKRCRVIIFAARFDCYLPDAPTPNLLPQTTIQDALADLRDVEPAGGSGRALTTSNRIVTQHSNESGLDLKSENHHLSQCLDGLAPTICRQTGIKHPNHARSLTTRERARLQSFPDYIQFCGGRTQQLNQIGNAVPVSLATCLAKKIYEAHQKVRVIADAQRLHS